MSLAIEEMLSFNKEKCTGCQACANSCPKNAIIMQSDIEGFLYPSIDKRACISCRLCEKVCPSMNIKYRENYGHIHEAYAYINKDDTVRLHSSSGGIFTELAERIISLDGWVYGVCFDEKWLVKHVAVNNIEALQTLRGAKYLQSDINQTYRDVKKHLLNDEWVMFTGTPCQVNGLYSYLGKDYDKLLMVDIICHGTPSPKVWKAYLDSLTNSEVRDVFMRDKGVSWEDYRLNIKVSNGEDIVISAKKCIYMKGFLQDLYLRPSCYACTSKGDVRSSDLTIADFWGINNVVPSINDHKGISLVVVHSRKGKNIIGNLKGNMQIVNALDALKGNPSYYRSAKDNSKRTAFFREFVDKPEMVQTIIRKYTKASLKQYFFAGMKCLLHRAKKIMMGG